LLQAFGSGLLLGIGGWLVIKGQISLGQLVASEIIVAKILDNFGKFTKYLESYYDLCASLDKVNHLLDFSEEPSGRESQYFTKGEPISLKIKNLKNSGMPELNFEVEKGQIAIIQDESNKHSSIVLDLLFGLTQSNQGIIEINSFQLQDLEISEWRENVFLLRDLEIFSGSIADNLKVNKLDSDSSEIRNALERVGLLNKIQELPMGINTEILRNGYPFSNEELALLVFARAILTKPGLLLIDGLLAYLGKTSLNRILAVLKEEKKHSTIIISSTIQDVKKISDSVFTFKDGILKEKEV
jgi:putative ABC transport system ATP-binding protein